MSNLENEELMKKLHKALKMEDMEIFDPLEVKKLRDVIEFYDNFGPHASDAIKAARFFAAMEQLKIVGKTIFWLLTAIGGLLVALDQIKEFLNK